MPLPYLATRPVKKIPSLKVLRLTFIFTLFTATCLAQNPDTLSVDYLKQLSLEDLMNIEITSVSKRPEKLKDAASAVQVITGEDIRNSGVRTLPEALKLAANLQVAQVNASQWAISARGFTNVLSNKLLVLVDGRTVYSPMYSGVFWDVQNVLLEDVDRIEVISGPGGTLWGANAVNGVINIITKNAAETQGLYVEGAYGSNLPGLGSIRYGAKLSEDISFRAYATGYKIGTTLDTNLVNTGDEWGMSQGGYRLDWNATTKDIVSLQSNIYYGEPNPDADTITNGVIARGDNTTLRWNHKCSEKTDFQLQAYYDHTLRDFRNGFKEDVKTYDLEWQNRFQLGQRHTVTYGLDVRLIDHWATNLELFGFNPEKKLLHIYSGFLQYEVFIVKERLRLTVGTKLEHNNYTKMQYSPNARLSWTPGTKHTIWGSVSRAVRNPSRIDREFAVELFRDFPLIMGSDSFMSETVLAYELGWRFQAFKTTSVSISGFYNYYDHLRSAEPGPPPLGFPIVFANGVKGTTYGVELAVTSQVTKWWNLRGGYTFLTKNLEVKWNSHDANEASAESNDPMHQFLLQSAIKLPANFQFGTVLRYLDKLPDPEVPSYVGLDLRISWRLKKVLELSVVGQNLLYKNHAEFEASTPLRQLQRSIYGKIAIRL